MHDAFPEDERRDDEAQRRNVDANDKMQCLLIKGGEECIGFFTVWYLTSGLVYVEHFAIADELRHCGYGTAALKELASNVLKPIILEVELPSTEESIRRIAFYEKNGFVMWDKPYIQPPYSSDKQSVPMRIMTRNIKAHDATSDNLIESAIEEIRRVVYNQG